MSAATHRAMLVLDVYAVDDTAAREIVDNAAAAAVVDPGIVALEASAPVRRRHPDDAAPDIRLAVQDAAAVGYAVQAFLQLFDTANTLDVLGPMPALVGRNKLEEIALRLTGGDVLEVPSLLPQPEPGEVYPLHRGSRA